MEAVWHFINHYIYQDLWIPTWPNWFAGVVAGALAYTWGKREVIKIHTKLDKHHAEHMAAVQGGKK